MSEFRKAFAKAKNIAIITGAGVSAESGVPTFRGKHEKWRKWHSQVNFQTSCSYMFIGSCVIVCSKLARVDLTFQDLASPEAFSRNPSRVWEFYHYRRELVLDKKPSAVHLAIAECEARLKKQGRSVVVITQCQDDLHRQAGSKHVLKIHGEC